jgi:hypothetical protein
MPLAVTTRNTGDGSGSSLMAGSVVVDGVSVDSRRRYNRPQHLATASGL